MKCVFCGTELPEDSQFCQYCGNSLFDKSDSVKFASNYFYCKRCGNIVDKQTRLCRGCGKQYFRPKKLFKNAGKTALIVGIVAIILTPLIILLCHEWKLDELQKKNDELSFMYSELDTKYHFYEDNVAIVCNNKTNYYHKLSCEDCDISNGVWFYSKENAKLKNYKPCPKCFD